MSAGLDLCAGDAVIPMDVDLQDPPELIPEMLENWQAGYDVVLAKRANRSRDSFFKRCFANLYYNLHNKFADEKLPEQVGDFRLMDRKVINALKQIRESCRFMKGLFAWVGFRSVQISYERPERKIGKSKFGIFKLLRFALDGITSFSTFPLKIWTLLGLGFSFVSLIYGLIIISRTILLGKDVPGYASILTAVIFLGGLQLIGLGMLGEYMGRTYMESKKRPIYLISQIYHAEEKGGDEDKRLAGS